MNLRSEGSAGPARSPPGGSSRVGKHIRAEPISTLYRRDGARRVGMFPQLEDQLCAFTSLGYGGAKSPDRADAWIWLVNMRHRLEAPVREPLFGHRALVPPRDLGLIAVRIDAQPGHRSDDLAIDLDLGAEGELGDDGLALIRHQSDALDHGSTPRRSSSVSIARGAMRRHLMLADCQPS